MVKQEQKIAVKPDTLQNLIAGVANGEYRIPQFQREYVWPKSKVIELFDSIYHEYPIGSFFLWKAGKEHNKLFRHIAELGIPAVGEHDNICFILDGQQRITSLYVTLNGMLIKSNGASTDYSRISFDVKDEKFTDRTADNQRYIAVSDIWGSQAMALIQKIEKEYWPAYTRCWQTLQTYPVSIVEVRDKDLPSVCKIFQRINQGGKRLERFDLISAMTFSTEFDLREKFKTDIFIPLKIKQFGEISPSILTQLLALMKDKQCTERHEFALTADDITRQWKKAVDSIMLAADTLRKSMGVINATYLPYDAILTLMAYYFAQSGYRSVPQKDMEWIKFWFWRASFGLRYGSGGTTRIGQDCVLFYELINGKTPDFNHPVQLTAADLIKTRMPQTGSAIRNAFLCLLANRLPVHLVNNSPLDLVSGGISDFTSSEKHHIFPKAYIERSGNAEMDIHSLSNFCFLPAELNKRILDKEPSVYFRELELENPKFTEAANTHLLAMSADSGILNNDYVKFLMYRGQKILEEVKRLSGGITSPQADERQKAIEQWEQGLRDTIDRVLSQSFDEKYWKTNIPHDIRGKIDERINEALAKTPHLSNNDFVKPRRRLDYCNVMEYQTIIENKTNWPAFAKIFRNQRCLQQYLSGLNDYRNVVMHSRQMNELVQKNGEAALIWFTSILSQYQQQGTGDEESEII